MATRSSQAWETVTAAIKDLTEQIGGLSKQITLLNGKIGEQSTIIVTQNTTIAKLSAKIVQLEGACSKGYPTSEVPAPEPIPQTQPLITGETAAPENNLEPTILVNEGDNRRKKTKKPRKEKADGSSKSEKETLPENKGEWKVQARKPRKRISEIITGTKKDTAIHAIARKFYIHAWRFTTETEGDHVVTFLKSIDPTGEFEIEKLITKGNYSSFKIGVPEESKEFFLDAGIWPAGIAVAKFKFIHKTNK